GQGPPLSLECVAPVRVAPGSDGDVVIVDGIHHEPFVGRGAVGVMSGPAQSSVRYVEQRVRHGERDPLAVRLVGLRILVGPPHAGAEALVGGHDPGPTQAVGGPGEAAIPGWPLGGTWPAMIEDGDRLRRALWLRGVEPREERVPVPPERDGPAVLYHAVDLEGGHEVDLHLRRGSRGLEHSIGDAVRPPDTRVGRADGDAEIVEGHVPPRPPRGGVGAAQRIGVREASVLPGERDWRGAECEQAESQTFHIAQYYAKPHPLSRRGPHPLSPSPPCGEGGRKGSPSFPLSTLWRGGQGVRIWPCAGEPIARSLGTVRHAQ